MKLTTLITLFFAGCAMSTAIPADGAAEREKRPCGRIIQRHDEAIFPDPPMLVQPLTATTVCKKLQYPSKYYFQEEGCVCFYFHSEDCKDAVEPVYSYKYTSAIDDKIKAWTCMAIPSFSHEANAANV